MTYVKVPEPFDTNVLRTTFEENSHIKKNLTRNALAVNKSFHVAEI